jgi:hypothetical protein
MRDDLFFRISIGMTANGHHRYRRGTTAARKLLERVIDLYPEPMFG